MSGLSAGIVVAVLLVLYLLSPAKPAYFRRRPLSFVREFAHTLFMMSEGSTLVIELEGSERTLVFRKAKDTGSAEQEILFEFPSPGWSEEDVEAVLPRLEERYPGTLAVERRPVLSSGASTRVLMVGLRGKLAAVGYAAHDLVSDLGPLLGLSPGDRFTFHVEGLQTQAIWRRVNEEHFVDMTVSSSWLHRRFARWQLDKLRSERKK